MKIEVDFEDVLDDFVETVKTDRYFTYDSDIQEYCEKMLDALPGYDGPRKLSMTFLIQAVI